MAIVLRNLMLRVGHKKFAIQGGDWGSIIGSNIATIFPQNVMAYHSNFCVVRTPLSTIKLLIASLWPTAFIDEKFVPMVFPLGEKFATFIEESGYFHIQATKPDTIGECKIMRDGDLFFVFPCINVTSLNRRKSDVLFIVEMNKRKRVMQ